MTEKFVPCFTKKKSFSVLKNVTNSVNNVSVQPPSPNLKEPAFTSPVKVTEAVVNDVNLRSICNLKTGSQEGYEENENTHVSSTNNSTLDCHKSEEKRQENPTVDVGKDEKVIVKSMSNSQYDRLFDSVVDKAVSGDIKFSQELDGLEITPENVAADKFSNRVQNKSPSLQKEGNEVTPSVSPQDQINKPVILPKPKKVKKKANEAPKRTSLGNKIKDESRKEHKRKSSVEKGTEPKRAHKKKTSGSKSKQKQIIESRTSNSQSDLTDLPDNVKWVQCSHCNKWRLLPSSTDLATLDDNWMCEMNNDLRFASCFVPEDDWDENSQESIVYADFSPGMFVWAKMNGYPMWPAIVDFDPDLHTFCDKNEYGEVTHYHVAFLDESVSRAWVSTNSIEKLTQEPLSKLNPRLSNKYHKDILQAYRHAVQGLDVAVNERLAKFGFLARFDKKAHVKWTKGKEKKSRSSQSNYIDKSRTPKISPNINKKSLSQEKSSLLSEPEPSTITKIETSVPPENFMEEADIAQQEEKDVILFDEKDSLIEEGCDIEDEPPLSQVKRKRQSENSQNNYELEY